MDSRTRRTILRKAQTSDVTSINDSQFNMYQFTGLNDSNNYATVDQTSFSDANNIYVDTDDELTTRPPVKYTEIFKDMPSDKVDAIYQSNGTVFYLSEHKLYWRWGDVENCIEDLYEEDDDGTIHYYTKFKIVWINDMFIVFEQYTDINTHTSLFGLQYVDNGWVRREVEELIYIPQKDYLTDTWLESKNILCDAETLLVIFNDNATNNVTISRKLEGQDIEITVRDTIFNIIWRRGYEDVLIIKVNENFDVISYNQHQCSADGSTILVYTTNNRNAYLSTDFGQTWNNIYIVANSEMTTDSYEICLSEDGLGLFVIFKELTSEYSELHPMELYNETYEDGGDVGHYAAKSYYIILYSTYISDNDIDDVWTATKYKVINNDEPFTNLSLTTTIDSPDDTGLVNGLDDNARFSVDDWWFVTHEPSSQNNLVGGVAYLYSATIQNSLYIKMHSPDYMHCAVLLPLNISITYYIDNTKTLVSDTSKFDEISISTSAVPRPSTLSTTKNLYYHYLDVLRSPLFINSRYGNIEVSNGCTSNMTALLIYNSDKEVYVCSKGITGLDKHNDATECTYGRIRYIPAGTSGNYELILSFNKNNGSWALIPLTQDITLDTANLDVTAIHIYNDLAISSTHWGTGGNQYWYHCYNEIDYKYDTSIPYCKIGEALSTRQLYDISWLYDGGDGRGDDRYDFTITVPTIFHNICNVDDTDDKNDMTDSDINELFRANSKSNMDIYAGDDFANFQDAISNVINVYTNENGTYINLGTLDTIAINNTLDEFIANIPDSDKMYYMKMPQMIYGDTKPSTDYVYLYGTTPYDATEGMYGICVYTNIKSGSDYETYIEGHEGEGTGYALSAAQILSSLFVHTFFDVYVDEDTDDEDTDDKIDVDDIPRKFYDLFETNNVYSKIYMQWTSIKKDITSILTKTKLLNTIANNIIISKSLASVNFVTDKFLYYGSKYEGTNNAEIDFFWLDEDFEFIPFALIENTGTFIGTNINDNFIYTNAYGDYDVTFEITMKNITDIVVDFPSFDSFLYNSTILVYDNNIYQTQIGARDNYEEIGYKKLYLPENTKVTVPNIITAINIFSQTVAGIFTEQMIYEYTYDADYGYYMLLPTKHTLGNRQNYEVIEALSGDAIYMSTVFGFSALSYENFVQSTEQQLTRIDSNIDTIFREFDKSAIKLTAYNYWTILYRQDSEEVLLYDARTSSWWKWTLSFTPDTIYRDGVKLYAYDQDKTTVYEIDFTSDDCKDYDDNIIDWHFISQKLHFGGVTYYKHINNLTVMATPKTNKLRYQLEFKNYHNGYDIDSDTVVDYYIESLGNCIKKVNFMKTNALQFKIARDDTDDYPTKFRMSNISIKYRVTEKIR